MEEDKIILNKQGDYRRGAWRCNKKGELTHVYDMFEHMWTIEEALNAKLIKCTSNNTDSESGGSK